MSQRQLWDSFVHVGFGPKGDTRLRVPKQPFIATPLAPVRKTLLGILGSTLEAIVVE